MELGSLQQIIAANTDKPMRIDPCSSLRSRLIRFLIQAAELLNVSPIVKYSGLSLFADRFYPALMSFEVGRGTRSWLLYPVQESNLQLFSLVAIWISSKIHDTPPLSVKNLKFLGDKFIKDQHYTKGDLLEAVLEYGVGMPNIAFVYVEELLSQLKEVACAGDHVDFQACMDIMDLIYEKELTSVLYSSPRFLAASILVTAYVATAPVQRWEFPMLAWVKFVTSYKEEEIVGSVREILNSVLEEDDTD